jgi:CRP-like cAMP-binding protein
LRLRNEILHALSADDLSALRPELEPVDLPHRGRLSAPHVALTHVYFVESGVASTTTRVRRHPAVEIEMTGREGICNLAGLLGADATPHETFMQVAGHGHRIELAAARRIVAGRPTLQRAVALCAWTAMLQIGGTAVANLRGSLSERLARWLLMTRDRSDGDGLPLTHDAVSAMLGVRRAGVTTALGDLATLGLVSLRRGLIVIADREGLIAATNGMYGESEAKNGRLRPLATAIG